MSESVITLKGVSKKYKLYKNKSDRLKEALHPLKKRYSRDFYALKNIDLDIRKGDIIGIVGKNGSGKSTLLKIISGVLTPTEGEVRVDGKIVALLELGAGLNPEFTGVENIYFYGSILGFTREEMARKYADIVAFSELGDFIFQPLKTYSSGMRARLAFSVSVFVDPDILILDEVLSVGDELFRRKCYAKMEEFFKGGKTILYVSHSADSVVQLCTKALLVNDGLILMEDTAKTVIAYYQKLLYSVGENKVSLLKEISDLGKIGTSVTQKQEFYPLPETDDKAISQSNFNGESRLLNKADNSGAYYVSGFESKNVVEYKNYDVSISSVRVLQPDGKIVNHLVIGREYRYQYNLTFGNPAENVSLGFEIKKENGERISTIESKYMFDNGLSFSCNANDVRAVSIGFVCNLSPGIYYVNIGVSSFANGEQTVLNRIIDADVFKVLPSRNILFGGLTNLFKTISFGTQDEMQ